MTFKIEHDFDDLFNKMSKEKIYNENTFISILKKTVKPLTLELDRTVPDSDMTAGKGAFYGMESRVKYGILRLSYGVYKSRNQKGIGKHAINLGYLPSKQDKAFVANFLNYGWKHAKSGKFIKTEHYGWMQKAEEKTLPLMKVIFDKEVKKTFEAEIMKKWLRAKKRRVK